MERLYRLLLRLYPNGFREEYGPELHRLFRERAREERHRGPLGRLRFAGFMLKDLLRSLAKVWLGGGGRTRWGARPPGSTDERMRSDYGRTTMGTTGVSVGGVVRDVRVAVRSYLRRPGFFVAAVATLALGVGASTAVFSVVDGVLLRALPYEDPEELVRIGMGYEGYDGLASISPPAFFDWRERVEGLESMAAARLERLTLLGEGEPRSVDGAGVSGGYFEVLDARARWGRVFGSADDREGAEPVAVLSHGAWQRIAGGDPGVLGRRLTFDDRTLTVVGVLPADFHPPEAIYHQDVEIWYPLVHVDDPLDDRRFSFLQGIGRRADGVSLEAVQAELAAVDRALDREFPDHAEGAPKVAPLYDVTVEGVGDSFNLIAGAVAVLLLIACANVANLFLVRATERGREMAVRASLGAGRGRLSRQLLVEALVVTLVAGVLGLALAYLGVEAFRQAGPGGIPRLAEVGLTARVLAFALLLSTATGLVFGMVPVVHVRRGRLGEALKEGATSVGGSRSGFRSALVVVQTALAVVLVSGAGVLAHSFVKLVRVDPGFDTEGTAWVAVRMDGDEYASAEARSGFFADVERRVAALPGVTAVGSTTNLPMTRNESRRQVSLEGMELAPDERPPAWSYHLVTPGFFEAMGIPRLRGRTFTASDDAEAPPVAVVNEALAARYWPDDDPLGQRFSFGRPEDESPWVTVVGVVGDVRQQELSDETAPYLYLPYAQAPRTRLVTVARAADPAAILQPMRDAVRQVAPTLPLEQFGTMESQVAETVVEPRFYALLLSAFGGVALVLAFVGIYGTLAYTVERRSHELGVRMAFGADHDAVLGLVLRRGLALTAVGVVLGLAAAAASGRVLESFVYGITPTDPATLAAVVVGLGVVAFLACWIPARRAAALDPVSSLRTE